MILKILLPEHQFSSRLQIFPDTKLTTNLSSTWRGDYTKTPHNIGKSYKSIIKHLTNTRAQKTSSWKTSLAVVVATVVLLDRKKGGWQHILPVGSNKAWTSMSSGKPTKLSSSQNLTTWSSEAVWVLTLVHDAILDRDLYRGAEKQT